MATLRNMQIASCASPLTQRSHRILEHSHDSASAFLNAFDTLRKARARVSAPTDQEQDQLRAMLVFAASGLDAILKQLIRDSLHTLVALDEEVKNGLEGFAASNLRREDSHRFLARILSSDSVQTQLIENYTWHLTGSSLQSPDELFRAVSALGLDPRQLGIDPPKLKSVFNIRNEIVHELDIDFDARKRSRTSRRRAVMIKHTNTLLSIAEDVLASVDSKLSAAGY